MDDPNKPPLFIAEEDKDLPQGPIVLPSDPAPAAGEPAMSQAAAEAVEPASAADALMPDGDIPVAATLVPPPVADIPDKIPSMVERAMAFKEDGITWFKEHKFLGGILLLLTFGVLIYFWPLITCALAAQHMLNRTTGTAKKIQMYKIVAILLVIAISVQAIWIVQLAQATSISPR
ncbi:hypothetical protein HYS00_02685 [Candidatus Microgenomates bacterium]|nr:hypothetical protein [Candidatus Microgenomates bacterium]